MAEYIEPFDFRTIFIKYFLGSEQVFMFIFLLIFSYVCAKFQMTTRIYLVLLAISSLMFAFIMGEAIYILIVLVVGYVTFKLISRIFV